MFHGFRRKKRKRVDGSPIGTQGDDSMARNTRCSEMQAGMRPETVSEAGYEVGTDSHHKRCQVLARMPIGCRCKIRGHRSCGAIRQRLLDLGFVPNAEVEVVRAATLGDPLEMRLGNYYVALRKREAELIEVREGA